MKKYIFFDFIKYLWRNIILITVLLCVSWVVWAVKDINIRHLQVKAESQYRTIQISDTESLLISDTGVLELISINEKLSEQKLFWQNRCLELGEELKELPNK